jgi:hypothetical protein
MHVDNIFSLMYTHWYYKRRKTLRYAYDTRALRPFSKEFRAFVCYFTDRAISLLSRECGQLPGYLEAGQEDTPCPSLLQENRGARGFTLWLVCDD